MMAARRSTLAAADWRPIHELRPNPENTRRHPIEQIRRAKKLLARFGFQSPITIDKDGIIWKGNGIFAAAAELHAEGNSAFSKVPVIVSALKGQDLREWATSDNQLGDMSFWDLEALEELDKARRADGRDAEAMGFLETEIRNILKDLDAPPPQPAPVTSLPAPVNSPAPPPASPPAPVTSPRPEDEAPSGGGRRRRGRSQDAKPQAITPPSSPATFSQERPIVLYYDIEDFDRATNILDDIRGRYNLKDNRSAVLHLLLAWRRDPALFDLAGTAP